MRTIAWGCIALLSLVGCTSTVAVNQVTYHGWQAYRLSNQNVDVVVVPAIGRIMRYGRLGGENLLWENPSLAGQLTSPNPGKWANFGGDKTWPWPQSDWTMFFGHDWPPPPGFDPISYQLQILPNHDLRLTSDVIPSFGLRVVREIHLDQHRNTLRTITKFQQMTAPPHPNPVAAWTITQWPAPDLILARTTDHSAPVPLAGQFPQQTNIGNVLEFKRPMTASAKLGLNADELGVVVGNDLIRQRAALTKGSWDPGDRAQVYCDKDSAKPKQTYVELEFTSPKQVLHIGDEITLQVDWDVQQLPTAHHSADTAVRLFVR